VETGYGLRFGRAEREAINENSDCERDKSDWAGHEGSILTCTEWPEQAASDREPRERYPSLITEKNATNNGPKGQFSDSREKTCPRVWRIPLHKMKDYRERRASTL
jgi:hypothetical protein